MVNVNYQYGMGGSYMGKPVSNTTYGQYNYYTTPQTIGKPIGGTKPTGTTGGGSSTTTTGNADAESWFKDVMGGKTLPFSPFKQSQMLSQQSDMSAAAEGAQNEQLANQAAMGGASASDPSMAAARSSNMAHRQTANQTAARDISAAAEQQNFAAQMEAASQLNSNAQQRALWAQQAANGAAIGMPFSPWGAGGGGGGRGYSTPSQTVGQGLFGNNALTNWADLSGNGEPWRRPLR